ncbi:MAG: hypothetical protein L3J12_01555 [Spirochaetales bacterium]|nr:hypothetical protein [Spirochaetales bacterium]
MIREVISMAGGIWKLHQHLHEWVDIEWEALGTDINGADGTVVGSGEQNTSNIIAYLSPGSTYAGQLCDIGDMRLSFYIV